MKTKVVHKIFKAFRGHNMYPTWHVTVSDFPRCLSLICLHLSHLFDQYSSFQFLFCLSLYLKTLKVASSWCSELRSLAIY